MGLKKIRKKKEVQGSCDAKPRNDRRGGAKCDKGDVLVIKPDECNLTDLGADALSILRTRTVKLILKFKRDKPWMGAGRSLWRRY